MTLNRFRAKYFKYLQAAGYCLDPECLIKEISSSTSAIAARQAASELSRNVTVDVL